MPVDGHSLTVEIAILGHCGTILFDKPIEQIDKDDIWHLKAGLLEGGVKLGKRRLRNTTTRAAFMVMISVHVVVRIA